MYHRLLLRSWYVVSKHPYLLNGYDVKKVPATPYILLPDLPENTPDSKVHGVNMGPTGGRQDPGGPHVGPMNLAI